jgi:hypothetical protein
MMEGGKSFLYMGTVGRNRGKGEDGHKKAVKESE